MVDEVIYGLNGKRFPTFIDRLSFARQPKNTQEKQGTAENKGLEGTMPVKCSSFTDFLEAITWQAPTGITADLRNELVSNKIAIHEGFEIRYSMIQADIEANKDGSVVCTFTETAYQGFSVVIPGNFAEEAAQRFRKGAQYLNARIASIKSFAPSLEVTAGDTINYLNFLDHNRHITPLNPNIALNAPFLNDYLADRTGSVLQTGNIL